MKTAFVLSGGGSAGAIETGALHELCKHIKPDILIGSSVGAINAGLYTSGNSTEELMNIWLNASRRDIFPINTKLFYKFHKAESIFSNRGLKNILQNNLKVKTFKECHTPLFAAATELTTGKEVYFNKGLLVPSLLASAAIPPLLPPHKVGNKMYIDGGLTNYIGTHKALELGAKQIVVINAQFHDNKVIVHDLLDLSHHAFKLIKYQALKKELQACNRVHLVEMHAKSGAKNHTVKFNNTKSLIQEGKRIARKAVKNLHPKSLKF